MGLGHVLHNLNDDSAVIETAASPKNASTLIRLQAEHGKRLTVDRLRVVDELAVESLADRQVRRVDPLPLERC